ncbi:hypothetical protein BIV57_08485 [Mangrovactinospora gilvigrisea]|uniref:Carrier domain-containing protein n=1 Tax=Mangrovactinospora gilvigrisea TaxID=1428644 RepID=A0A1J7BGS9_9ACTN|nr:acyl carrier protein [Mangrovactinospora gilvigrisea]OIV37887.1 hypothetical protein BIV57_08485 [Mangrovactinospora gilvigrisea]
MSENPYDALVETLTGKFDVPPGEAAPETVLGDIALDSLVMVELTLILEDRLGFPIDEGALRSDQTVLEAANTLAELRERSRHQEASPR